VAKVFNLLLFSSMFFILDFWYVILPRQFSFWMFLFPCLCILSFVSYWRGNSEYSRAFVTVSIFFNLALVILGLFLIIGDFVIAGSLEMFSNMTFWVVALHFGFSILSLTSLVQVYKQCSTIIR
jgi:hypothetical protein